MGRLVMALPAGRQLALTVAILAGCLGVIIGIGFLLEGRGREMSGTVLSVYRIALGLPAWLLFCLFIRWYLSFVLKKVARFEPFPDAVPAIYRLWLAPYSRADIAHIHAVGRGADLFATSMLMLASFGLLYAILAT
ncbi:hypothetical protein [Niveispirillum sp. BGYR6]|uniref:hypothetical protein n=1 Tax=Niveispirillum sp. BGYR6 TaxID=2971249 RepID=UPI0022B9CFC7|nr:hypothetical protein [Niveispirillum sp. BGYR6]MDG5493419.1 hypothetical protein [Niveispirillum sp. BGYR6]